MENHRVRYITSLQNHSQRALRNEATSTQNMLSNCRTEISSSLFPWSFLLSDCLRTFCLPFPDYRINVIIQYVNFESFLFLIVHLWFGQNTPFLSPIFAFLSRGTDYFWCSHIWGIMQCILSCLLALFTDCLEFRFLIYGT